MRLWNELTFELKMRLSCLASSGKTAGALNWVVQSCITMTSFKHHVLMYHEEGIKLLNLPTTHQIPFRAPSLDSGFFGFCFFLKHWHFRTFTLHLSGQIFLFDYINNLISICPSKCENQPPFQHGERLLFLARWLEQNVPTFSALNLTEVWLLFDIYKTFGYPCQTTCYRKWLP